MNTSYPVAARMKKVSSSAIRDLLKHAAEPGMISLAGGLPAPDLFDLVGLSDASASVMRDLPIAALQYGVTAGQPELRLSLANLMATRGAAVDADSIVVTTGSQQGIDLMARVMLDRDDLVCVERPAYLAAIQTFALAEARFLGVDVDEQGMKVDQLEALLLQHKPKFIYTVATFANPSGATLSLARRKRLLELAVKHQVFVVEDDPYGELRSRGSALPPLIALAREVPGAEAWCGYLSTLSKILAPGFRIGWAILPPALRNYAEIAKQGMDLHTSTFTQAVASRYLDSGRMAERLPTIRASYQQRNEALSDALHRHLQGALTYQQPDGGMFLWAKWVDGDIDSVELLKYALPEKMIFVPGEHFYADAPERNTLRLSFATPTCEQIDEGIRRLAVALEKMRAAKLAKAA
ncbi:MAG: PLP-dependent aminotransferase family protein [Betaproteobacteria bacterium]|nr:PLP-dependent aminotransferase family protein [Betaproteobacteria bacterium]